MKNELLKLPPIAVRDSVRAPIVVLCRIDGNIHFFASFFFSLRWFPSLFLHLLKKQKSMEKTSKGHKVVLRLFGFLIQRKKWKEEPKKDLPVYQTVGY